MKRLAILPFFAIVGACATTPETIKVPVPVSCVTGELPAEPPSLNGTLTGDSGRDIGLIAGAEKQVRAWGKSLYMMLEACRD